tara:strand:- start:283 stop:2781 length:2499 start_codon:yes stop_codon:yes gene_type:complete
MVFICDKQFEENQKYNEYFNLFPHLKLSNFQKWAFKSIVDKQHILITAHTGSGKTLPAEFAIQYFINNGKKVIYTAPIKALSNTKLSDFRKKYPSISFGIITGDITDNPDADVLIMTTEILPNTIINQNLRKQTGNNNIPLSFEIDIENELGAVIFDEVHYINDQERGSVWEQAILLLPPSVQMIMLSATIDKASQFAQWIEDEKNKQASLLSQPPKTVYLASTNHRVVPLTHYLWITTHKNTIKKTENTNYESKVKQYINKEIIIKDINNVFNQRAYDNINSLNEYLKKTQNNQPTRQFILNSLVEHLKNTNALPAICFVFSKKHVEYSAKELNINLYDKEDTTPNTIEDECKKIIMSKIKNYKEYINLPEYSNMISLLKRGIGIHHAGILSIFREITEMLFEQKKIKILFATETLAVGINFSTASVIFTDIKKYDGSELRILKPHEYTQISGRAGRRGFDKVGKVWLCCNLFDIKPLSEFKNMLFGPPQTLISKFKLSFNLCLNLLSNGKDISTFTKSSLITVEIDKELQYYNNEIDIINKILKNENDKLINSKINKNILIDYLNKKNMLKTSSNKQKKQLHREIKNLEKENINLQNDIKIFEIIQKNENDLIKIKNYKSNAENYINQNITNTCNVLEKLGFSSNNKSTELGIIAGQFQEIHPLAISLLIYETNYFYDLTTREIVGLISCFNNIKVSNEFKKIIPSTDSEKLNILTNKLSSSLINIYDMELLNNINTGSCYDINFDIQNAIMKWCDCNTEDECKIIIQKLNHESGIFIGEFIKAILKINNIAYEISKVAEITNKINLLEKINKIPDLTLKYVATNQSLYL